MKERVNWTMYLCVMKNGLFMYMLANYICFGCRGGSIVFHAFTFFKINFSKNSFKNITRMSNLNGLDLDQDQHSISPDLGPNCLQRLSKSYCCKNIEDNGCLVSEMVG